MGEVGRDLVLAVRGMRPLLAVSASIVALAIGASLVPALRASRVDPVQSLRAE
jgi:ABC-type lipoprotein release transport system permease subunit